MAKTAGTTGRFGRVQVNTIEQSLTKWNAKPRKEFADGTDSNNYDTVTGQLWTSQYPGAVGFDGSIEGLYDTSGIFDTAFIQSFKIDGPFPIALYITRTLLFMSFMCDITDVDITVTVPGAVTIPFTANFKTNGAPVSLP
jgi:hypothetical protein